MRRVFVASFAVLGLFVVLWSSAAQESSYLVIVNKDNPADSLSKDELSDYLLKKKSRWENGIPAAPVDLDSKSSVREAFSQDVHGRSVSSIKNYWQRQIFSGRGAPPPELTSDDAVISYVASNSGAIGYVSKSSRINGGVKAVAIN